MSETAEFNPALPESHHIIAPNEGGNGVIHKPGQSQNIIWQTRSRAPERWELQLIEGLEVLFEAGAETLEQLVSGLNARGLYDQHGTPWREETFAAFLDVNGY
ncbi:hypothetical protein TUM12370_06940 [Salmonella enterica subsp. enterica serovar Choleraesuis]|nr:hypothetical protein TUM12370_06940 [Salmonella enterica subsp. enterica serovar Choleraesuis]